jgi:hypothetical protein
MADRVDVLLNVGVDVALRVLDLVVVDSALCVLFELGIIDGLCVWEALYGLVVKEELAVTET